MRPVDLQASIGKTSEIAAQQKVVSDLVERAQRESARQSRRAQQVTRKAEVAPPLVTYDRKGKRRHGGGAEMDERR